MCAINKCLLYAFLCLAIFCEIDSKGQIPTDGVINIDDTLKGEVIEGSGRSNDEDDVDQEESSGLEDDEDTPLLSSMTPGVPDGRYGHGGRSVGGTDATSFEPGSGDGRQGTTTPPSSPFSSTDDDDFSRRRNFFASSPPPPPTLPPASPSTRRPTTTTTATTSVPTTTTTTTTTATLPPHPPYRNGDDEDDDVNFGEGSALFGLDDKHRMSTSSSVSSTTTTTTTTAPDDIWRPMVDPVRIDYPDDIIEPVEEEKEFAPPPSSSSSPDDDDEDVEDRGSGFPPRVPGGGKPKEEVSKPPQTNYKFKKPDPTKFLTPFAPDENRGKPDPKENDDMNKIDHRGGTGYPDPGYDKKNPGTGDEEISNEIPVIGKAVMGPKESRTDSESLWHQPGILAGEGEFSPLLVIYLGIIGAAVVGLLCAVLLVMFIVYRMRKKDEGSYDLDETTKRSPRINGYQRTNQNEFYA